MEKGGGLQACGICLLVFKESNFLMPASDSCRTSGQQKAACTEEVELAQSHLGMFCTDLDELQERHRSVIQRITNLEETLRGAWEEEFQLKIDAETKSLEP